MIEAARVGSVELVRLLLRLRGQGETVNVEAANVMGWTPLMEACRNGHYEVVKCLIDEGGARADRRDKVHRYP